LYIQIPRLQITFVVKLAQDIENRICIASSMCELRVCSLCYTQRITCHATWWPKSAIKTFSAAVLLPRDYNRVGEIFRKYRSQLKIPGAR
jgi:hypothetical protein